MKVLAVCDSPTVHTGFGRVAQNLLKRWHRTYGAEIDVWGVNYLGLPHELPYRLFPAACGGHPAEYNRPHCLQELVNRILVGRYDIIWMMADLRSLSRHGFPEALRQAAAKAGSRTLCYFPADSRFDRDWWRILECVDQPVAYTEQGREQLPIEMVPHVEVIPHGVDTSVYYLEPFERRMELRRSMFSDNWVGMDDILLLNVNQNQKRKDTARSLQLLSELLEEGVPAKLVMHMPPTSVCGTVDLMLVGPQLGLRYGTDWIHTADLWMANQPRKGEDFLRALYNAADFLVTTTLGEGWGLSITEALGCGCPVAVPDHTSCREIVRRISEFGMGHRGVLLPVEANATVLPGDASRVRYGVNVREGVEALKNAIVDGIHEHENRLGVVENMECKKWLDWDRIAAQWMDLFHALKRRTSVGETVELTPTVKRGRDALDIKAIVDGFSFRAGTCDRAVFANIIEQNEYRLPPKFDASDVVIDIGAHIGSFTAAVLARGAGRIVAFEAEPRNADLCRKNLADAIEAGVVEVHEAAVWRESGWLKHTGHPPDRGEVNTGGGNVWSGEGETAVVALAARDMLRRFERVRLVKMDCEGSEWAILRALELEWGQVDEIIGEYHEMHAPEQYRRVMSERPLTAEVLKEDLESQGFEVELHPHQGTNLGLFWAKRKR